MNTGEEDLIPGLRLIRTPIPIPVPVHIRTPALTGLTAAGKLKRTAICAG